MARRSCQSLRHSRPSAKAVVVEYTVEIIDEAKAKLRAMPKEIRRLIGHKIFLLENDLTGNVKKLKGSTHEYRLRVGDYRVIFELEGRHIVVYDVGDRKDIYH
jgi:mRNA interferase RelE/StbE